MRSRNDLGSFLNSHALGGIGAEIGVYRGEFSRKVLDKWTGKKLYLVDCWEPQPPVGYQDIHNVDGEKQTENLRFLHEHLTLHSNRYEMLKAYSRQAASGFADASLDFVYIDANHMYPFVVEDLRHWWPKVKVGGLFAGMGYFDGLIQKCLFGVKTAVDEFAREHQLQVRLTYDKLPSWFLIKPPANRELERQNIGVLTAHDQKGAALAQWSVPNKAAYCQRHGYRFICRTEGFDGFRPASWSKINFLREDLPSFDWLFWTDADSLIMNHTMRMEAFADDDFDIVITMEDMGVGLFNLNAGQILIRNSPWSLAFLDQVWAQTQFINDRLWENRAILHLWEKDDLSRHIQVVTQNRFNSYPINYRKGDFMIHFPSIPDAQRIQLMQTYAQFAIL